MLSKMSALERQLKRLEWRWQRSGVYKWEDAAIRVQAAYRGHIARRAVRKLTRVRVMRRKAQDVASQAAAAAAAGANDQAFTLTDTALALDVDCAAALVLRSRLLYARGDYMRAAADGARGEIAAAVTGVPDVRVEAQWALARAAARSKNWETTAAALARLLGVCQSDVRAHVLRGHACLRMHDGDSAVYHFTRVMELRAVGKVMQQKDLLRRGVAYAFDQDWGGAEADLTEAIRRRSQPELTADAHAMRGHLYAAMREFPSAAHDFRDALRINADCTGAAAGLVQVTAPAQTPAAAPTGIAAAVGVTPVAGSLRADTIRKAEWSPLRKVQSMAQAPIARAEAAGEGGGLPALAAQAVGSEPGVT